MPSQTGGRISSALARLLGRRLWPPRSEAGLAPDVVAGPRTVEEGPRTFQGRPVVKIMWKGEEVEAVQGLTAYRMRERRATVAAEDAERVLNTPVLGTSEPDELGIGVIATDEQVESERVLSLADELGPDVLWTEPVLIDRGALNPNDTEFSQQWGLPHIRAPRAWDLWNGDPNGVVLAILDSGISMEAGRLSHPDLSDHGRISLGRDLVNNDDDPADDHGHGTHVAGIAAATRNNGTGIAGLWPGSVFVLKVFNGFNLDGSNKVFENGIIAAVNFARQGGARLVINYSGGGPDSATKLAGVQHALNNGALLVAAAGNNSGNPIFFPAAFSTRFSNVIAVGAVGRDNRRPAFGSRGPEMTVVAPGVDILSTLPNYTVTVNTLPPPHRKNTKFDRLEGTSQAAPLVAALAALIWSERPQMTAEEVRDRIIRTAAPLSGSSRDIGNGLIDAEAALS